MKGETAPRLEIGASRSVTVNAIVAAYQRYVKAADRKRLAREAMVKLVEGGW